MAMVNGKWREWSIVTKDNVTYTVQASDAAAAITYVVAIKRFCEHIDIISVQDIT